MLRPVLVLSKASGVRKGPVRTNEIRVRLTTTDDVVIARRQAMQAATDAGFQRMDSTLIATVASEMSREILRSPAKGAVVVKTREDQAGVASLTLEGSIDSTSTDLHEFRTVAAAVNELQVESQKNGRIVARKCWSAHAR